MRALLLWMLSATSATAPPLTPADIDRMLAVEWKRAHVQPARPADDARFFRRLNLDLAGVIPTAQAAAAFLDDPRADKRTRALDALLESDGFVDHFTDYWDQVLMGKVAPSPVVDRTAFRDWLHDAVAHNLGWDELARALITAKGENSVGGPRMGPGLGADATGKDASHVKGAVNWQLRYARNVQDLTGKVSRLFLGVQIQCAQCHDHKTERWKQDDFRRLAAAFARTGPRPLDDEKQPGIRRVALDDFPIAVLLQQKDAELKAIAQARPTALDGVELSVMGETRRQSLAAWVTSPQNPWFARAIVNRVWAYLLGRGFVEPIDDFRRSNPIVAPQLLDRLAGELIAHKYDLKWLIRLVCQTRAYALSPGPARGADAEKLWARYRLRALGPEMLLASLGQATHVDALLARRAGPNIEKQRAQLRNAVHFLFDVDEELEQTEYEGTVPQALMLLNGAYVNAGASALPGTTLDELMRAPGDAASKIGALYLSTLGRRPTAAEVERWNAFLDARHETVTTQVPRGPVLAAAVRQKLARKIGAIDPTDRLAARLPVATEQTPRVQAYEDLFWALLNSSEFYFRH